MPFIPYKPSDGCEDPGTDECCAYLWIGNDSKDQIAPLIAQLLSSTVGALAAQACLYNYNTLDKQAYPFPLAEQVCL